MADNRGVYCKPAYLARTGLTVFAIVFAITLCTEHIADGRALVVERSATVDLPQLREVAVARIARPEIFTVAGFESAPSTIASPAEPVVLASWYGPGFYGNRTACGQIYTPEILGVARLTLPCGTTLTLTHGSRSITVTVIDRGPYVAGRAIDLSNATKLALACTDLCTVRMQIGR
jgi:rare lipoprotein A (peptidoglycan hydrolase)